MIVVDVNVLIYSYRQDADRHAEYRSWLDRATRADAPCGAADVVLSGFLRIVTNPRAFSPPAPVDHALGFIESLRQRPAYVSISPGARHWDIFARLCRGVNAKGNVVPDAYIAALAIQTGSQLFTADRGFGRFPGLRWRHPLDPT